MSSTLDQIMQESDPYGAKILGDGRVRFRHWMPSQRDRTPEGQGAPKIHLKNSDRHVEMEDLGGGWYEAVVDYDPADRDYQIEYWSAWHDGWRGAADPMSYQLSRENPGFTRIFDLRELDFSGQPKGWKGIKPEEQIIVETHIGTLTKEGNLQGAKAIVPHWAETGYTAVELMPIGKAASRQGWSYDEYLKAAIQPEYGDPQDLVDLIGELHRHGIALMLDIIDNHVGVNGEFEDHSSELASVPGGWGNRPDMSIPEVRKFFIQKNLHWLDLGADGFRQDATHTIHDTPAAGRPHYSAELYARLKTRAAALGREIVIDAEREDNKPSDLADPNDPGKPGIRADGQWADDFCHAVRAMLFVDRPGEGFMDRGYLAPYVGNAMAVLAETLSRGFALEHGEDRNKHRTKADLDQPLVPARAVHFFNNHDQVGNLINGERIEAAMARDPLGPQKMRAVLELLIMNPAGVPLFFHGQEYGAKNPFFFFANWEKEEHRKPLIEGRKREFMDFFAGADSDMDFPDPCAQSTVDICTLDLSEARPDNAVFQHFKDLVRQRKEKIIPHLASGIADVRVEHSDKHIVARYVFGDGAEYAQGLNIGQEPVAFPAADGDAPPGLSEAASKAFAGAVMPQWQVVSHYKPAPFRPQPAAALTP